MKKRFAKETTIFYGDNLNLHKGSYTILDDRMVQIKPKDMGVMRGKLNREGFLCTYTLEEIETNS